MIAGAIVGFGRVLGLLPMSVGVGVGRLLGWLAHAVLVRPRRFAREHVAIAFPERDAAACGRLVRETFVHAGASFAELALFEKIVRDSDYVRLDGATVLEAALAQGRGVIAATGHCGNWELLAAWGAAIGWPITVVVRRVTDLRFHALIVRFRTAAGVEVLVRDDPNFVRAVGDALRRNRIVAMLIDQDTRGAGVFVPFFGRLARTPPGAAVLALRGKVPLVTAFIERRADGGHLIRVTPVPLDVPRGRFGVEQLTGRLTAAIEAQIRRVPAEWVWWHERWRTPPERHARLVAVGGVERSG